MGMELDAGIPWGASVSWFGIGLEGQDRAKLPIVKYFSKQSEARYAWRSRALRRCGRQFFCFGAWLALPSFAFQSATKFNEEWMKNPVRTCVIACRFSNAMDAAFDIHHVDEDGKEIALEQALRLRNK